MGCHLLVVGGVTGGPSAIRAERTAGATSAARDVPRRARVVVVGGGIAGCSVLYHLTQLGWRDVVLVEKGELTCGSTWHAAGLCTQFNASGTLTKLLMRSMKIYEQLGGNDGGEVGLRKVGSLRLATTRDRVDELTARAATARTLGLPMEIVGPEAVRSLFPLARTDRVLAAAYLPTDGYIDPSMTTQALAAGARAAGAELIRQTRVTGFRQHRDGWIVETERGEIECEFVVNAAGQWARRVGEMVGVHLPVVSLQHQYVVTEPLEEVRALKEELPVLRDTDASYYVRQEGEGLMVGPFERSPLTWMVDRVPDDFEARLLPGNLEQIMEVMLAAAKRIDVLGDAGLKNIVNGPDGYTPDGLCLMGEVPGQRGFFVLAGFSIFGIVFGGGAGAYAAEWIVNGQPGDNLRELDVRRFGSYAESSAYVSARAREVYEREYAIEYPEEESAAGRPLRTSPLYDRLLARGAVFGVWFGWERPLSFQRRGVACEERHSFRVPGWHDAVAAECRGVRSAVGVLDQMSCAKFQLSGPRARALLDWMCANEIPAEPGRIARTQMLTGKGGIECDVTVTMLAEDRYYVVSGVAEEHDLAWIRRHAPNDGSVSVTNMTAARGVLTVAGPSSRELLQRLTTADVSGDALPHFHARQIDLGLIPVLVMRLSQVGELGFELHHQMEHSRALYELILAKGEDLGLVDFGYRALKSMRLEKAYRLWGADITGDHTPLEAGFEQMIDWRKDFQGRAALERQRRVGLARKLVTLSFGGRERRIPHPYMPVIGADGPIGWILAGGWGHIVERGIALADVPPDLAHDGTRLSLDLLGQRVSVEVTTQPLYDPNNERLGT